MTEPRPKSTSSTKGLWLALLIVGIGLATAALLANALAIPHLSHHRTRRAVSVAVGLLLAVAGAGPLLAPRGRRILEAHGRWSAGRLLLLSVWFGLLTGFAESAVMLVRHWYIDRGLAFDHRQLWIAPLTGMALFAAVGVVLVVLAWRWPWFATARFSCTVLLAVATAAVTQEMSSIHKVAVVLLIAGVGYQGAIWLARRQAALQRCVRWSTPALLAGLLLTIGVVWVDQNRVLQRWQAQDALRTADTSHPNVVLIVMDTVRAKSTSFLGCPRDTTPHLAALAERGVTFERALSTSPWTLPSHGSMFTGRMPRELFPKGATPLTAMVPISDQPPTLAEVLRDHGYATAGFIANYAYCSPAHGLARGFVHYESYRPVTVEEVVAGEALSNWIYRCFRGQGERIDRGRKRAAEVTDELLDWTDGEPHRPFFAFLNYFDAHEPYRAPPPFDRKFAKKGLGPTDLVVTRKYGPMELAEFRTAYESCIAYLDQQIGRLVDGLEQRGLLDNTLLIVTADHGEQFGEHGFVGHTNTLYPELLHVPLLIVWPGHVPAGERVDEHVSLIDLASTVLDLTGVAPGSLPGTSLASHWQDQGHAPDTAFAEILVGNKKPPIWLPTWPAYEGGMKCVFQDGYHYIRRCDHEHTEELYDFLHDPDERHDLSGTPEGQKVLQTLRGKIGCMLQND